MSAEPCTIEAVIAYMDATPEDSWRVNTVRSEDGGTNCFFGHLFNMGRDERESNHIWNWFEDRWATTFMLYPVNDGEDPRYPQATPKQRVLAFLHDLRDGKTLTTAESMEAEYASIVHQFDTERLSTPPTSEHPYHETKPSDRQERPHSA